MNIPTDKTMTSSLITRQQSLIMKGIGICLMLTHHLFYSEKSIPLYDDIVIHGHGIVNTIGVFSKLCVALFVFVSGYGLAVSTPGNFSVGRFYIRRFRKLYLNYWLIWLIFVPIGIFVFHRTFEDVYNISGGVFQGLILDILGVYNLFGHLGYNPTWWFYSCIILLYLLFPVIMHKWKPFTFLQTTVAICISPFGFLPFIQPICHYLLPFMAGIIMAKSPRSVFDKIRNKEIILAVCVLVVTRLIGGELNFIIDTLLCIAIALLTGRIRHVPLVTGLFERLGKHSMNMFLFHTFIYYYWFSDIIYYTGNPFVIFLSLIGICYPISCVIEFLKRVSGFYLLCR